MKKNLFWCLLVVVTAVMTACTDSVESNYHRKTVELSTRKDSRGWEFDSIARQFYCHFEVSALTRAVYSYGNWSLSQEENKNGKYPYQVLLPRNAFYTDTITEPTVVYYTQHIDYHKTFDNYRDTKKRLFDGLKKKAFAVTNKDDKNGLVMTQNCKAAVHTYSTRSLADYKAQILEEGFDGMMLNINGKEVFVPLVGRFNVSNLLCIYGAAINLGFDEMEVLRVLSTLKPVNGRFETIHSPKGWTAIVDYAHTPDAVDNVILS